MSNTDVVNVKFRLFVIILVRYGAHWLDALVDQLDYSYHS